MKIMPLILISVFLANTCCYGLVECDNQHITTLAPATNFRASQTSASFPKPAFDFIEPSAMDQITLISKYLLGDPDNNVKPYPLEHMEYVMRREFRQVSNGINLSQVKLVDGRVLIPYLKDGRQLDIQAMLKNASVSRVNRVYELDVPGAFCIVITNRMQPDEKGPIEDAEEFRKIFSSFKAINDADQIGLLESSIPRWADLKEMQQWGPHEDTVGAHTLGVMEVLDKESLPLAYKEDALMMAFFHDFGKSFYNPKYKGVRDDHNIEGSRITSGILLSLGFSKEDAGRIAWYVKHHAAVWYLAYRGCIEPNITDTNPEETTEAFLNMASEKDIDILTKFHCAEMKQVGPYPPSNLKNILDTAERLKGMVVMLKRSSQSIRLQLTRQYVEELKSAAQNRGHERKALRYASPGMIDYHSRIFSDTVRVDNLFNSRRARIVFAVNQLAFLINEKSSAGVFGDLEKLEMIASDVQISKRAKKLIVLAESFPSDAVWQEIRPITEFIISNIAQLETDSAEAEKIITERDSRRTVARLEELKTLLNEMGGILTTEQNSGLRREEIDLKECVFEINKNSTGVSIEVLPFQEQKKLMMREHGNILAVSLDIANYLFGDTVHDIHPLPLNKLENVLTLPIYYSAYSLAGIDLSKVTLADDVVSIPYSPKGYKYNIRIALRGSPAAAKLAGCEITDVSDRYIITMIEDQVPDKKASIWAFDSSHDRTKSQEEAMGSVRTRFIDPVFNNNTAGLVNMANTAADLLKEKNTLSENSALPHIDRVESSAQIRQKVEDVLIAMEHSSDAATDKTKSAIALLENGLKQLEADGIVATIIAMARIAKYDNRKIYIGFATDWITAYNDKHSLQHMALESFMHEIENLPKVLRSMGLDNVELVVMEKSEDLAADAIKKADAGSINLSNTIIIASKEAIESGAFDLMKSTGKEKKAFIAGIDSKLLSELYSKYGESWDSQLNIDIAQLLALILEVAAGKDPPQLPLTISYDKASRILILLPSAAIIDYDRLLNDVNKRRMRALQAA